MNWPIAVAIIVVLCACERAENESKGAAPPPSEQPRAAAERKPVFPEPEAVAVLRAISDAEIAISRIARDVSQSDAVASYARVVAADHGGLKQILDSTAAALGQAPVENALSAELRAHGDSIALGLSTLPSGFNNTYIEEDVKSQQRALQLLDTALIPSARNPELKQLFQAMRPTIAAHLQRAAQILAERKRAAAERGEPWESGFKPRPIPVGEPIPAETVSPDPRGPVRPPPTDTIRADTLGASPQPS